MRMNRLIPMLPVRSMPASVEFYRKLGFTVEQRRDDWGWAMLRLDDCRLMVDQSINRHPAAPRQSVLYLYPDNIADYHQQVRASGLPIPDLEMTFYGLTEFRLDDPDGNPCGSARARPRTRKGGAIRTLCSARRGALDGYTPRGKAPRTRRSRVRRRGLR